VRTVTGPPCWICELNAGTTEPREPSVLPKRTPIIGPYWRALSRR
jgi:hypothetical protein